MSKRQRGGSSASREGTRGPDRLDRRARQGDTQVWDASRSRNASPRATSCRQCNRRSGPAAGLGRKDRTTAPAPALIALCLHDEDRACVECWCIRLGRAAPDPGMRVVAALGISYLACRFRKVDSEAAELVADARSRPDVAGALADRRGRATAFRTMHRVVTTARASDAAQESRAREAALPFRHA